MITIKKEIVTPRLEIRYCGGAESPRTWSNLGYFITVDNNYSSPDDNKEMRDVIIDTAEYSANVYEHQANVKRELKKLGHRVLYITPVTKYEHSGVVYRRGAMKGFDYSTNGFYIVTHESAQELGTKLKDFERVIDQELEIYSKWANGEVYSFTLYDEDGDVEDSCGGFYDIEDIRGELPAEFKDEELGEYMK